MDQKIEIINNWNLKKVFDELENGNLKIPRFQRGYVWERGKIVKLLNSIYKQYPIGSFFLWVASKEYQNFCREISELKLPETPESNTFSFILDGQQRITSLFVALKGRTLSGTDYASICFNVEKKEFHIPRLKTELHNVPAWKLFDTISYGDVLTDYAIHDRENGTVLSLNWRECQQVFTDYPISIIKTLKMELDEVVTIFERINQGGKRLSLFDLVHASSWSTNFDLREKIKEFNSEANVKSFGGVENEVFIQSLSLNAFGDCRNKNQLDLTADIGLKHWHRTTECIRLALDYVKSYGVRFIDFLPYNSFLPILQYYFYKSDHRSVQLEDQPYIENWFWTATFSQRFSSSSLTKMKDDAEWVAGLVEGKKKENEFGVALTVRDLLKVNMQSRSVIKNGVLCLMALENPVDFDNSAAVVLDRSNIARSNGKENHHFFPFSLRENFNASVKEINSLMNFALISGRLNRIISNDFPDKYVTKYEGLNKNFVSDASSHFISLEAIEATKENDFNKFTAIRAQTILDKINTKILIGQFAKPL